MRLSLFADMVKGKVWQPATLDQVGGAGVGRRSSKTTGRARARAISALCPRRAVLAHCSGRGSDIRGAARPEAERGGSGYADQPAEFELRAS